MRVGNVEQAGLAVVPGVHPKAAVIGGDGDIHRQGNLAGVADVRHRLGPPIALLVPVDQPDLGGQRGGGEAVVVAAAPGAADLQGGAGNVENLARLAGVQIPDDHGVAEALHGLLAGHHLAQVHHVVVPAGERRGDQQVAPWQHPHVIAVAVRIGAGFHRPTQICIRGQPMGGQVVAAVGELHQPGAPVAVLIVGQAGDQHAPRHGVAGVRPHHAAGTAHEVVNGLDQLGHRWVAVNIKDEDLAAVQAAGPKEAPVIRKAGVMRLVAPAHRQAMHHLPIARRIRVDVHGDQLVLLIAHAGQPQGPDVNEVLLPNDLRHVGGHAGFISRSGRHAEAGQQQTQGLKEKANGAPTGIGMPPALAVLVNGRTLLKC